MCMPVPLKRFHNKRDPDFSKDPSPSSYELSYRQLVYGGIVLTVFPGVFFVVRHLTACWQLTALPGIPPSYCVVESVLPSGTPVFDGTGPSSNILPPEVSAPEMEIP